MNKVGSKVTLIPTKNGFTVQDPITRRKIGTVKEAFLRGVRFRVWESGRRRHLAGPSYQHVFIDGTLANAPYPGRGNVGVSVKYDPQVNDSFVIQSGLRGRPKPIKEAVAIHLSTEGLTAYGAK